MKESHSHLKTLYTPILTSGSTEKNLSLSLLQSEWKLCLLMTYFCSGNDSFVFLILRRSSFELSFDHPPLIIQAPSKWQNIDEIIVCQRKKNPKLILYTKYEDRAVMPCLENSMMLIISLNVASTMAKSGIEWKRGEELRPALNEMKTCLIQTTIFQCLTAGPRGFQLEADLYATVGNKENGYAS